MTKARSSARWSPSPLRSPRTAFGGRAPRAVPFRRTFTRASSVTWSRRSPVMGPSEGKDRLLPHQDVGGAPLGGDREGHLSPLHHLHEDGGRAGPPRGDAPQGRVAFEKPLLQHLELGFDLG
jgi:hypothetical protein